MPRKYIVLLKVVTWVGCLSPLMLLVYEAVTNTLGPDPTANITFTTGYNTLLFLILSLAITPVRSLSPRLSWLIQFRRLLGLFAFFYGTLHFFTWIALYTSFDVNAMVSDILKRRYITAGMFAWLCLLPLAATSTTWSIRKLGGKRWRALHRLAYVAGIAGVIHYWWQVKPGVLSPLNMTIALGVLLLARPVLALMRRGKTQAA
ncbi:MAG: sulfoxide reductase heme-binding subunit YedZ [Acidobacteriota bacterium]|nr:sulfoxide reductase heme-binding subunit YedZ [Acidobacteriota bacterium]